MTSNPLGMMQTVGEAATTLQVSPSTVRNWIAKGYLHAVSLPSGQRRIPEAEVDRLVGSIFQMPTSFEESDHPAAAKAVAADYGSEDSSDFAT